MIPGTLAALFDAWLSGFVTERELRARARVLALVALGQELLDEGRA